MVLSNTGRLTKFDLRSKLPAEISCSPFKAISSPESSGKWRCRKRDRVSVTILRLILDLYQTLNQQTFPELFTLTYKRYDKNHFASNSFEIRGILIFF